MTAHQRGAIGISALVLGLGAAALDDFTTLESIPKFIGWAAAAVFAVAVFVDREVGP